jgi:DNA-directed RNA polymerase subunit H
MEHQLVPKHTILKESEREELLNKYGITMQQLPKIVLSDPVVMALNGKIGEVIKIIRKSQTAGESIYYRVVSKG